jgi:biotin carboxylase
MPPLLPDSNVGYDHLVQHTQPSILAIASYEKGHAFLRQAKASGARVFLLTSLSLKDQNNWPREVLDDIFYMPDMNRKWDRTETLNAVSFLCRSQQIDRIVPLDDFDLEMAASLREHLRIPGMGETTVRYFRDKLAMRMKAEEAGLPVPDFCHVLNHARVDAFLERVPPPWILKPRLYAGAIGIRKIGSREQFWQIADALGDEQSYYLVERFVPGSVYHVDTIVYEREILFAVASAYGRPPFDVAHGGGVFTTRILEHGSEAEKGLLNLNKRVLAGLGLVRGVSHTEFILGEDAKLYFLETSARVGGAHIAELIEAATGLNLWAEWAKIEIAGGLESYSPAAPRQDYAGLLVSLARSEHPDTSSIAEPEIVWRIDKPWHVGFIVRSHSYQRVGELLCKLQGRVTEEFTASAPAPDRPTA